MTLRVFVCSTYSDLAVERQAVLDAIRRLQLEHDSMEYFGARPNQPIETCLEEVRSSDLLVVVVGHRYGSIAKGIGVSFSEAEYNEGFRLQKPIHAYVRDDSVPVLVKHVERDSSKQEQLEKWKRTLADRHTVCTFRESSDLALQVAADLSRSISKIEQERRDQSRSNLTPQVVRAGDASLLSRSVAEDYLHSAVEALANKLVDTDDQITSLIADTNASGFYADHVEILEVGTFNFAEARIPFRARVQLTGEQDEDQMFSGNKIFVDISGTLGFDGSDWEIDDYDVAAEAEDVSE
jgi:hypothetical protein